MRWRGEGVHLVVEGDESLNEAVVMLLNHFFRLHLLLLHEKILIDELQLFLLRVP
jgi:hypothetical protein